MSDTALTPIKPLAITMGDPAGIGPEITLKVLADETLPCRPVVVGDAPLLSRTIQKLDLDLTVVPIADVAAVQPQPGVVHVLPVDAPLDQMKTGDVSAQAGQAAFDYIKMAIEVAREGDISGIVTAPIHKEALSAAGVPYPGHTEMLTDLGGATSTAMMLANEELRVVLVTIHIALRDVADQITRHSVLKAIKLAHDGTRQFGIDAPRVAVAGLNPHAGEGGLFGREEIDHIAPAIADARALGIDASGPWSGDTVFMQARKGQFDVVVAQYHDQGLIPVKYMGLDHGVNITLGLPFVRTSPDHGTAFDIAGQGIADPSSMRTALDQAVKLVQAKLNVGDLAESAQ